MAPHPFFTRVRTVLVSLGLLCGFLNLAAKDPATPTEAERVEVKFAVRQSTQIENALKHFGLDDSNLDKRETVSFYDTKELAHYKGSTGKVIFRSRIEYKPDGKVDEAKLTLKIRKDTAAGGPKGAKCEWDFVVGATSLTLACAWQEKVDLKRITSAQSPKQIAKLFAALAGMAKVSLKGDLRPFGPVVNVRVWDKPSSVAGKFGPDSKVSAEHWKLPAVGGKPAQEIFELSVKVPKHDHPAAADALRKLMQEAGASFGEKQEPETKTGLVLEHFAP